MNNSGISENLQVKSGVYTEKEIWGQPELWQKIYEKVLHEKASLVSFLEDATANENLNIILTGAGSSAFIGLSLISTFKRNLLKHTSAVSTTDLVTHPNDCFYTDVPVLLISFARSGNSPESVAAVILADKICSKVYHLIITCDTEGELAKHKTNSQKYTFILPADANDKSLAMTGSYTGMLLAGLLVARINEIEKLKVQVTTLSEYALKLLEQSAAFREIAEMNFDRAVFLGSGPLYGTATESHLKLQELTDGKVICKKDSFLGFRHGPKVVIDQKTLVFLLFSNKAEVLPYETDLLNELSAGPKPLYMAGLTESGTFKVKPDKLFVLSETGVKLDEEFLPVCFILPAQMIGFYKSLQQRLDPDMPSKSGSISRVVKGVVIYPYINQQ
ncbi:MAG: SIS domain-containing protein [Lentimicrobiaceae bacterium]|jgi:tagatose-6-phosphate ketose/aldose isomerase